jgi:hypothetical protein
MPEYVECALARFGHPIPDKPQHQPHPHTIPIYGATVQYTKSEDASRQLSPTEKKFIQEVIDVFLYYGRAVDSTMLTMLSAIASTQAEPTKDTMLGCKQFLDYATIHQDTIITYRRSNMVLIVHSNASYLSKPKAPSRAGRPCFSVHQHCQLQRQWRGPQTHPTHQDRHVLHCRSQTWCTLYQCPQGHPPATHTRRNGTQATPNADTNRQQHSTWHCQ